MKPFPISEVTMASLGSPALALLLLLALAAPATAQRPEDFEWRGVVPAGRTIEVRGIHGDITATGVGGTSAVVRAVKRGEESEPRDVRIEVVEDGEGVLVCAVYPSGGDRPNECRRDHNRSNVQDNDVEVDFEVGVPAGVRLVAVTVNGEVEASGLDADVEASSVNGDVAVETAGTVSAHTVNGSVEVTTGRARWTGTLDFATVNGSITLHLPADVRADVEGSTLTGDLDSDFPLEVQSRRSWGPTRFEGTIGGGGGGRIEMETVNGTIRLRRAS